MENDQQPPVQPQPQQPIQPQVAGQPAPSQTPITSDTQDTQNTINNTPPQKKSNIGKIIIWITIAVFLAIVIPLILVIIFIFGVVNNATSAPLSASETFLKSIQSGNSSSAYTSTSTAFQATEDQAKFAEFVKQYNTELNPNYTVVISKNVNSNNGTQTATIDYNVQTKNGAKNEYMRVELIQENGQWKIQNIQYQPTPFGGSTQ